MGTHACYIISLPFGFGTNVCTAWIAVTLLHSIPVAGPTLAQRARALQQ